MQSKQKTYLILSIIIVGSGQILTLLYRPYIYTNKINDFGFADTIGSLVSVIGFCFFFWAFKEVNSKEKNKYILFATFLYAVLWEMLGLIGVHGNFGWKDIIAGIISGVLTYILKNIIEKQVKIQTVAKNPDRNCEFKK